MAYGFAKNTTRVLLVAAAVVGLAGCGSSEPEYEADATDASGGELIVEDADAPGVDVTLPETEMTNAPAEGEAAAPAEGEAPAAE